MSSAEEQFLQALRETFKAEAREHLETIVTGLLDLEKPGTALQPLVEAIFRAAHSLKGAARAVNFTEIELACQTLEDLFAKWKRGEEAPTPKTLDVVHQRLQKIEASLETPKANPPPTLTRPQAPILTRPQAPLPPAPLSKTSPAPAAPPGVTPTSLQAQAPPASATDTVRISVTTLDERLLEAEEMLAAKLSAAQHAGELEALRNGFDIWRKKWALIQPLIRTHSAPPELTEFCDWNHDYIRALEARITVLRQTADQDRLHVGKLVDDLLRNAKKLLMMPLATLTPLLQKIVRDLCRDQSKEAELTVKGGEIALDKRILDELKDPLIHVLRNSIDHGVEKPAIRAHHGKPTKASIVVTVTALDANLVEIAVSDDGSGIDVGKLKNSAIQLGLITKGMADQLSDQEAQALVFEADLSTSQMITQVSGRGLGLAIVREKCERLGGYVKIESKKHRGTTISMTLPLTMATFRGVAVRANERTFIAPTAHIERVGQFNPQDVRTIEGRETVIIGGKVVGLLSLARILQLPPVRKPPTTNQATPLMVVGANDHRVAFAVDQVLTEKEILVKRLKKPLCKVRNISGACILSTGEVALILNVNDLIKSARRASGNVQPTTQQTRTPEAAAKRILVAEDSITSRMLIKGILESAGYDVRTAFDGIDAYTTLRSGMFDLMVSDVEMPRLNGFDLTARIRAERGSLAELPIILVTALESREDREHGIDVGANAYLVKSGLDQTNLLDAVRRLA
jgi:two-component system, chemotaxis family, sensor kinase CheA